MIPLIYIIQTVLVSGLLFGYYLIFLRNRPFHGFNRFFLLAIPWLGFLLPAFHFQRPLVWSHPASGSPVRLLGVVQATWEQAVTVYGNRPQGNPLSLQLLLWVLIWMVSFLLFIRFYQSLRYLAQLRRDNSFLVLPEARIYFVSERGTPFSFSGPFSGEEIWIYTMRRANRCYATNSFMSPIAIPWTR